MAQDDGTFVDRDYRFVTVLDRTGKGGAILLADGHRLPGEIMHDGRVYPIKPLMRLRAPLAKFLFGGQRYYLHDATGAFVNRFGIPVDLPANQDEDAQELIRELGPDACEITPIRPDVEAVEHWDVAVVDPVRAQTIKNRIRRMKVPAAELRQQETAGGRVTVEKG